MHPNFSEALILVLAVLLAIGFGLGSVLGAPFVPSRSRDVEELLSLADLKPGQRLIDLGSGEGRLLRAAARRRVRAIGYEINPFIYLWSVIACVRYRNFITIHLGSYWAKPLPEADVIYIFLVRRYMRKLHGKLANEIARPTTVISYIFEIPGQKPSKITTNAYIYQYGESAQK